MDRQVWTANSTFAVGGLHLGVRTNLSEFGQLLRETLRAHLVEEGEAPPNFSVKIAGERNAGPAGFHVLYRSSSVQLRTRDPQRLVAGLFAHLGAYHQEPTPNLLAVHGMGLFGDGGAVIAPVTLFQIRAKIERRLNESGVRIADEPWILLDSKAREIVIPEPSLTINRSALRRLGDVLPDGRAEDPVGPGRYPLLNWTLISHGSETVSRGQALALGIRSILSDKEVVLQPTLDSVADVFRSITPVSVPWGTPAEIASRVAQIWRDP